VIDRIIQVYLRDRVDNERFIDTAQRLGITPFKDFVYATPIKTTEHYGEDAGSPVAY
jgi:sulfite reductase (NADPH) hemoprotein beta-component